MKKILSIVLSVTLIIGILGNIINVAYATSFNSASIRVPSQTVTVGDTVTITVSLGQSVSAAQFILNFDSSKLQYISKTGSGTYFPSTKRYSYYSEEDREDLSQVSFEFKAQAVGATQVSVNDLKISKGDSLGKSISVDNIANITIKEKTTPIPEQPEQTPNIEPDSEPTPDINTEEPEKPYKKPTTPIEDGENTIDNNENSLEQTNTIENQVVQKEENNIKIAPNKIIKLLDSDSMKIEDKKTNIMVKALEIALQEKDIVLSTSTTGKDSEIYKNLENIMKDIAGKKTYYDIKLIKGDKIIQPNGYVTVFIPIPEGYNKDNLELYYIDEKNEKYEFKEGEIQDNYYTFTTNHFSIYALVDTTNIKTTNNSNKGSGEYTIILFIIITLIIAIIIIEVLTKIEKMKENKKY